MSTHASRSPTEVDSHRPLLRIQTKRAPWLLIQDAFHKIGPVTAWALVCDKIPSTRRVSVGVVSSTLWISNHVMNNACVQSTQPLKTYKCKIKNTMNHKFETEQNLHREHACLPSTITPKFLKTCNYGPSSPKKKHQYQPRRIKVTGHPESTNSNAECRSEKIDVRE